LNRFLVSRQRNAGISREKVLNFKLVESRKPAEGKKDKGIKNGGVYRKKTVIGVLLYGA
jgi:hypothetical protein